MSKTAVVTGAGSGVGRAAAIQLAREGWSVGVIGRRQKTLEETIHNAGSSGSKMLAVECDVADRAQVEQAAARVREKIGEATALVAAAGMNIPNRSWEVL